MRQTDEPHFENNSTDTKSEYGFSVKGGEAENHLDHGQKMPTSQSHEPDEMLKSCSPNVSRMETTSINGKGLNSSLCYFHRDDIKGKLEPQTGQLFDCRIDKDRKTNESITHDGEQFEVGEKEEIHSSKYILIRGIPRGLEETVLRYLESRKKGGGNILFHHYNQENNSMFVQFRDRNGKTITYLAYFVFLRRTLPRFPRIHFETTRALLNL